MRNLLQWKAPPKTAGFSVLAILAIGSLVRRFPGLALADPHPPYREHVVLRGLQELRLSLA